MYQNSNNLVLAIRMLSQVQILALKSSSWRRDLEARCKAQMAFELISTKFGGKLLILGSGGGSADSGCPRLNALFN